MNLDRIDTECKRIQLEILQDYYELRMKSMYHDAWIRKTFAAVEEAGKAKNNCRKIIHKKEKSGERMVSKKDMDVTCITTLLQQPTVLKACDCWQKKGGKPDSISDYYSKNILPIRNDRNEVFAHASDYSDLFEREYELFRAAHTLRDMIIFLEKYKDLWRCPGSDQFLSKYHRRIHALIKAMTADVYNDQMERAKEKVTVSDEKESREIKKMTKEKNQPNAGSELVAWLDNPNTYSKALAFLQDYQKEQSVESGLLLAFMKMAGFGCQADKEAAQADLVICDFLEPDSAWNDTAREASRGHTTAAVIKAAVYFAADGMRHNDAKSYYNAGQKYSQLGNYEFCMACYKCAAALGFDRARKIYDFFQQKEDGKHFFKEQYHKLHNKR